MLHCIVGENLILGAGKMTQGVRMLATKPDNLSSIARSHTMEVETNFYGLTSIKSIMSHIYTHAHTHIHAYTCACIYTHAHMQTCMHAPHKVDSEMKIKLICKTDTVKYSNQLGISFNFRM